MHSFSYRLAVVSAVVALGACGVDAGLQQTQPEGDAASTAASLRKAPRVDSVSPLSATLGTESTFTVTGANLGTLSFELADCAGVHEVAPGSSSTRRFACTPSNSPGQKAGGLRNPNGSLAYSFFATITTSCTQPTVTGSFAPSGNSTSNLDSLFQAQNPIVRIEASGDTLTFTARNGETGALHLSGSSASGLAQATSGAGFDAFRVIDSSHLGISSQGAYHPLTFTGVSLTAPFDGFMFLDPIFNGPSWATQVSGVGNTVRVTDVFGATGVITLNCAP